MQGDSFEYKPVAALQPVLTAGSPPSPRLALRRAAGLKALCLCELLFALWIMVLGGAVWLFMLYVPVNSIGFYGAHCMRKVPLTVFAMLKTLMFGLYMWISARFALGWSSCTDCSALSEGFTVSVIVLGSLLIFQAFSLYLATKLRQDLMFVQGVSDHEERSSVELEAAQPVPHFQESPSSVPSPAAPAPSVAPGYPYPPQYYPMPYTNQMPQGYPQMPYATPYANPYAASYPQGPMPSHLPQTPFSAYPTFTVGDDQLPQQQQNSDIPL